MSVPVLVIDFGSQVTQLIVRRVREAGVYCEIAPFSLALAAYERMRPKGIILSGSPAGVPEEGSPRAPQELFETGLPILGICYGQQVMSHQLGGSLTFLRGQNVQADEEILIGESLRDGEDVHHDVLYHGSFGAPA